LLYAENAIFVERGGVFFPSVTVRAQGFQSGELEAKSGIHLFG
jgi:hypothetical protein